MYSMDSQDWHREGREEHLTFFQLSSQAAQAQYLTVDTMLHNELFIDFVWEIHFCY